MYQLSHDTITSGMIVQQLSYLRRVQWDQGSSRRHSGHILLLLPILLLLYFVCFISTTTTINIHDCCDNVVVVMQLQLHISNLLVEESNIRQFLLFLYTTITTNLCCTYLTSMTVSASFIILQPTISTNRYIHRHHHTWNHIHHKLSISSQQRDDTATGTVDRLATTSLSSTTINNNETTTTGSTITPDQLQLQSQQLLTIPIFPLQKMVKLPTNNITLNLYESRYIQMIEEAVLLQSNDINCHSVDHNDNDQRQHQHDSTNIKLPQHIPMFGTIYTKNLPHIVTTTTPKNYVNDQSTNVPNNDNDDDNNENDTSSLSSNTLIVPILETNMIGVLCIVTNHTTTTTSNNNKNQNQKVIRINATGIFRFKIIDIVHRGYNTNDPTTTGKSRNNVPYIVAKIQLLPLLLSSSSSMNTNPIEQQQLPTPTPTTKTTTKTNNHQLPSYIQNIITKYGCTLLSYYYKTNAIRHGGNNTINNNNNNTIILYKNSWIQELLYYYQIESKHSNNTLTTTLSYQEQKQRLQLLIHPYQ